VEADAELIVLDMRNLTFMDSRGMSIVVAAAARLRRDGRRLVAVRGPREVDMVFTLAGTPGAMEFFDLEAAEPAVQVLLQMAPDAAEAS
jgi:anti-anti-sigma factor